MKRFWNSTLEPILDVLTPSSIVEIGSAWGANTKRLLDYAESEGATVHVIDPMPSYVVEEWEARYGDALNFHRDLSLNALPEVPYSELVLIDGDHNWYTVFNELKLIKKLSEERERPFPLVLLHDVEWPYGRRDLYYNPENIPEEHRHPYAQKGMDEGSSELLESGGVNRGCRNAIYEGGSRNGVLTAVEDFMNGEMAMRLELRIISAANGLGILFQRDSLRSNEALRKFLDSLPPRHLKVTANFKKLETENRELREDVELARQKSKQASRQDSGSTQKLIGWLEELDAGVSVVLDSRRWKIGNFIGDLGSGRMPGRREPEVAASIRDTLGQFRSWKRRTRRRAGSRRSGSVKGPRL